MEPSQVRAVVDCRETYRRDVREEFVLGNVCGGKPGSHGIKAAESRVVGGAIIIASLPPAASVGS